MNRDTRPARGVDPAPAGWRKSSRSSGGANCVEINFTQPGFVHIRDSKDRGSGPMITVTLRRPPGLADEIRASPATDQCSGPH